MKNELTPNLNFLLPEIHIEPKHYVFQLVYLRVVVLMNLYWAHIKLLLWTQHSFSQAQDNYWAYS